jgi:hypothetical protein
MWQRNRWTGHPRSDMSAWSRPAGSERRNRSRLRSGGERLLAFGGTASEVRQGVIDQGCTYRQLPDSVEPPRPPYWSARSGPAWALPTWCAAMVAAPVRRQIASIALTKADSPSSMDTGSPNAPFGKSGRLASGAQGPAWALRGCGFGRPRVGFGSSRARCVAVRGHFSSLSGSGPSAALLILAAMGRLRVFALRPSSAPYSGDSEAGRFRCRPDRPCNGLPTAFQCGDGGR